MTNEEKLAFLRKTLNDNGKRSKEWLLADRKPSTPKKVVTLV